MTDTSQRASKIIALLHEKVRLEPSHRRTFYLVFGLVWLSGGLWLVAEWLKEPELGPIRTPLQTTSMKIHGAAMLIYLAMLGTLLTHIRRGFALRANRFSGSLVIGVNVVLVLSGWLLYYITDDSLREWSSVTHWTIGLSNLPLLCTHVLLGRTWSTKLDPANEEPAGEVRVKTKRLKAIAGVDATGDRLLQRPSDQPQKTQDSCEAIKQRQHSEESR
jgi:hypothetical protein